jgi:hypothetical protein
MRFECVLGIINFVFLVHEVSRNEMNPCIEDYVADNFSIREFDPGSE